ncbi:MAG TPA: four helix bundle protein [Gammaproteobacteria bacterium]|nr:four helix bundle protein [Gammaproteobacteria bacterium]
MALNVPRIVKASETALVATEEAVAQFARYHRYATGHKLRQDAWAVAALARKAWVSRDARTERITELSDAIDELKLTLQIAQRLRAFRSFKQFEALIRLVSDLGRQCGSWQRSRLKGQNRETQSSLGRARTLSARDASAQGANP